MRIDLKNINFSYENNGKTLRVLKGLNLTVEEGEFVSILGPSGCGKTTLLKYIAGFLGETKPSKDIFLIHQDFDQLFPWRTLLGNVVYAIRKTNKKIGKEEAVEAAVKALNEVGLKEFINYYPHALSGGMKQRGALARALALGSKVLLMDEPFSSLDEENRKSARQLLLKLFREKNFTVVFVTHDLKEAKALSGKVLNFVDINGKV